MVSPRHSVGSFITVTFVAAWDTTDPPLLPNFFVRSLAVVSLHHPHTADYFELPIDRVSKGEGVSASILAPECSPETRAFDSSHARISDPADAQTEL